MSAAIKLSPEAAGQLAELGVNLILGAIAKRQARPVADMTEADLLADAHAFVAGYESTDAVVAEERARLGVGRTAGPPATRADEVIEVDERGTISVVKNPEAAGTVDQDA